MALYSRVGIGRASFSAALASPCRSLTCHSRPYGVPFRLLSESRAPSSVFSICCSIPGRRRHTWSVAWRGSARVESDRAASTPTEDREIAVGRAGGGAPTSRDYSVGQPTTPSVYYLDIQHFGGVAERFNAPVLKTGGLTASWVRIPPPPSCVLHKCIYPNILRMRNTAHVPFHVPHYERV